ncbi:MAG: winged helix-turn-helix domain-containing protein, partial [Enhydrobacter sp.]|nr:winged helix-turn-helix domain-containing protein [Enhydrobacter sp.]
MSLFFANHELDVARRELRQAGKPVALEPQVFDLLVYLIENRDRVVSKDDLIENVWSGRNVSESTLTSRINAARTAVGDNGTAQRLIRTSARKGFRFIGEVRDTPGQSLTGQGEARPGKAVLAVRPFATPDDDGAVALGAGLVDAIMTGLARFRLVAAVARDADDKTATYTLTGAVQRAGETVRISARLIDRHDGAPLWAERYDRRLDGSFAVQDEIAQAIVAGIEQPLVAAENRRGAPDPTGATADVIKAAGWHLFRFDRASNDIAIALLDAAVRENPGAYRRQQALSMGHCWRMAFGWTDAPAETAAAAVAAAAVAAAEAAVRLNDEDAWNFCVLGWAAVYDHQFGRGLEALERAVALNPNSGVTHGVRSWVCGHAGDPADALRSFGWARRLAPLHPFIFMHTTGAAWAEAALGHWREAEALAETAVLRRPNCFSPLAARAAVRALAGDEPGARAAIADLRRVVPEFTLDW